MVIVTLLMGKLLSGLPGVAWMDVEEECPGPFGAWRDFRFSSLRDYHSGIFCPPRGSNLTLIFASC